MKLVRAALLVFSAALVSALVIGYAVRRDQLGFSDDEQWFFVVVLALGVIVLATGVAVLAQHRNLAALATVDPLTKLPNRGEFERGSAHELASMERDGAALLLFDLDGFKAINDTHGHRAGDETLAIVATRLRGAVRRKDLVARWGGDEFTVLMPGICSDEMGVRRAHQLADQICGPVRLDGIDEPLRVEVSVGVALAPRHGHDTATLVDAADQAMYRAKREGLTCRIAEATTSA